MLSTFILAFVVTAFVIAAAIVIPGAIREIRKTHEFLSKHE